MKNDEKKYIKSVGSRITEIRTSKNLTQEQVAAEIGMHQVSIAFIENGMRSPKLWTLNRIAKALGVNIKDLLP